MLKRLQITSSFQNRQNYGIIFSGIMMILVGMGEMFPKLERWALKG